jgi:hypothetical protein
MLRLAIGDSADYGNNKARATPEWSDSPAAGPKEPLDGKLCLDLERPHCLAEPTGELGDRAPSVFLPERTVHSSSLSGNSRSRFRQRLARPAAGRSASMRAVASACTGPPEGSVATREAKDHQGPKGVIVLGVSQRKGPAAWMARRQRQPEFVSPD